MKVGDLIRIKKTGAFGIVIDPYAEDQPVNGFVCRVLTCDSRWHYLYWVEVEMINESR